MTQPKFEVSSQNLSTMDGRESLITQHAKLETALATKVQEQSLLDPESPTYADDAAKLQKVITTLQQTIQNIKSLSLSQDIHKKVAGIAASLKDKLKLTDSTPADSFWIKFEQACRVSNLSAKECAILLYTLTLDHKDAAVWYENNIVGKTITMGELKNLFYKQFLPRSWKTTRLEELYYLTFRKTETPSQFVDRFLSKMLQVEYKWDEEGNELMKDLLVHKCPPSVQRLLGDKEPKDFKSCKELSDLIRTFPGVPNDVPNPTHHCSCCSHYATSQSDRKRKSESGEPPVKKPKNRSTALFMVKAVTPLLNAITSRNKKKLLKRKKRKKTNPLFLRKIPLPTCAKGIAAKFGSLATCVLHQSRLKM